MRVLMWSPSGESIDPEELERLFRSVGLAVTIIAKNDEGIELRVDGPLWILEMATAFAMIRTGANTIAARRLS